jgi:hypothetical protein
VNPDVYADRIEVAAPDASGAGSPARRTKGRLLARIFALGGLGLLLLGFGEGGLVAYRLVTDSFVAPLILSKDSDTVVQSKLSLSRLLAERQAISVRMQGDQASISASEQAVQRLEGIKSSASKALDWTLTIAEEQTSLGARDLSALEAQETVITRMIKDQEALVSQLHGYLDQGMIHKADLVREEVALNQLRVAALGNERDRLGNELQRHAADLTQRSLQNPKAKGVPATPEAIAHQDQLVRLDLEILKLRAEIDAKQMQREADRSQLDKIDQLLLDMKTRPIFRAIESSQNVAFVPYTQIDGVSPDATVIGCKLWGLFLCHPVGRVAELVQGEVVAEDPWGAQMRGRYAILELDEARAAESKSLRVRADGHENGAYGATNP